MLYKIISMAISCLIRAYFKNALAKGIFLESQKSISTKIIAKLAEYFKFTNSSEELIKALQYHNAQDPNASNRTLIGFVDEIVYQEVNLTYQYSFTGWMFHIDSEIINLILYVNQSEPVIPDYHLARPDLAKLFGFVKNSYFSGFQAKFTSKVFIGEAIEVAFKAVLANGDILRGKFSAQSCVNISKFDYPDQSDIHLVANHSSLALRKLHIANQSLKSQIILPTCSNPKISILLFSTDDPLCFENSLLSIKLQSFTEWELLVYESPKASFKSCHPNVSGLKIIKSDQELAPSERINLLAKSASGQLILILQAGIALHYGNLDLLWKRHTRALSDEVYGGLVVNYNGDVLESGGVLCSDGSAFPYGYKIEACDSICNTECTTNFVSCLALAIKRQLFIEKGLANTWHTLLYASADFCINLAKHGCKILVLPNFATTSALKDHAHANVDKQAYEQDRRKFFDLHTPELINKIPNESTLYSIGRNASTPQLSLLYIAHELPSLHNSLSSARSRRILSWCKDKNISITVAYLQGHTSNDLAEYDHIELYQYTKASDLAELISKRPLQFGLCMISGLTALNYYNHAMQIQQGNFERVIYEAESADNLNIMEKEHKLENLPIRYNIEKIREAESKLLDPITHVLATDTLSSQFFLNTSGYSTAILPLTANNETLEEVLDKVILN